MGTGARLYAKALTAESMRANAPDNTTSSSASEDVVTTEGLTKRYGDVVAVDRLDLRVGRGEIIGLLGPNGAGKTTTINLLLGLLAPSEGRVFLFGQDLAAHRATVLKRINFASAYAGLPRDLSVRENLRVFADLYEVKDARRRIDTLIDRLGLADLQGRRVWRLSAGQRMRVVLAKALLNEPEILMLDEPTASLDPETAERVRADLLEYAATGKTLIWTSHNLAEVERHCTRVVFMHGGRVALDGPPARLVREAGRVLVRVKPSQPLSGDDRNGLADDPEPGWLRAEAADDAAAAALIAHTQSRVGIEGLDLKRPTLEDLFLILARGGWS